LIGVLAKEGEARVVAEFFELFKTPWEFWRAGRKYELVIITCDQIPSDPGTDALLVYSSRPTRIDEQIGVVPEWVGSGGRAAWQGSEFPICGEAMTFRCDGHTVIRSKSSVGILGSIIEAAQGTTVRVGFDLFGEVAFLLTCGQPAKDALVATLDLQISLLRFILQSLRIPFVEVPPAPHGYDFVACLTHDVDFVGIRDHKLDHTLLGFLYRASLGSLVQALRGRLAWSKCVQNWKAVLSLPLVYMGVVEDFWLEFERYWEIEKDFGSTFYFLPFRDVAGRLGSASAPRRRAAKYDIKSIEAEIGGLIRKGCEIGLHGIDAWQDVEQARIERKRVGEAAARPIPGTRMHWLYWSQDSPGILEDAGFSYDSTFGYNDAVGFRAGTSQPFCPLNARSLLELPLNIQDSAMFYTDRMTLSEAEALHACRHVIGTFAESGGALTVNWHTRSLSPERLWDHFYGELLGEIQKHRVWFGTAEEVIAWFRARRALAFDDVQFDEGGVRIALGGPDGAVQPPFNVRVYDPRISLDSAWLPRGVVAEKPWNGEGVVEIAYCRGDETRGSALASPLGRA